MQSPSADQDPQVTRPDQRPDERGSGTVEWLGISALSVGVLVALFAALQSLGLSLIEAIGNQLGL